MSQLLEKHRHNPLVGSAEILTFKGVDGFDVYNISAPFTFLNRKILLGRVELRESEKSVIAFFEESKEKNVWVKIEEALTLELQDPFFTFIDNKLIIGGVKVYFDSTDSKKTTWKTCFYQMDNLSVGNLIFEGPIGMKDLRLHQLPDGQILVLTRPQGEKGGRGKIGYQILPSISDLSLNGIESAPLLKNQFIDEEWGGANEIYDITNKEDTVGVLGHIAKFDDQGNRHYYAMTFELCLQEFEISKSKIIAERLDFLPGPTKRPDLKDVVFSGGLVLSNKTATLYAGLSDASAQKIKIKHPFQESEG